MKATYVKKMRKRDPELGKGWGQIATPLVVETDGGQIGKAREGIVRC
jgi:DNA-damage-inducible protein D